MLLLGYLLLALVVAAVLFYLVVALLPAGLGMSPSRDRRPVELPVHRRVRAEDLERVRIPVSLRGYRFAETDELIERLAAEIEVRDEEIARLKQYAVAVSEAVPASAAESPVAARAGEPAESPAAGRAEPEPAESAGEPEWAVRELGEDG